MVVSLKHFNYNKQNTFVLAGNNRSPTRAHSPPSKKKEKVTSRVYNLKIKPSPSFCRAPGGAEPRPPGACVGFQSGFGSSGPGTPRFWGTLPAMPPRSPPSGCPRRQVEEAKSFTDAAPEPLPRSPPGRRTDSCSRRG